MLGFGKKKDKKKASNVQGDGTLNSSLLREEHTRQTELPSSNPMQVQRLGSPTNSVVGSRTGGHAEEIKPKKKHGAKEGYQWDFCIVVPDPEHEDFEEGENVDEYKAPHEIIERLHLAGLETYQYYSGDHDEIFIKIKAPLNILRQHAENIEYKMLLDDNYIKRHIENQIFPMGNDDRQTRFTPYEFIYASYDDSKRNMFKRANGLQHPFSSTLRIKLIYDIISNDEEDCCSLNLRRMKADGSNSLKSFFPLHGEEQREELSRIWFGWRVNPWEQPLDEIKEYVGEKISLYFAFVGHYTTHLVYLITGSAIITLYFFVMYVMTGTLIDAISAGYLVPFFCIFVAIWAQLMLEYWKQTQNYLAMQWGQTEFEEEEDERPEFEHSEMINSLVNGLEIKYFSPDIRNQRQAWSLFVMSCWIIGVLMTVSLIFYLQYYVNSNLTGTAMSLGNGAVSILQAGSIVVLNMGYGITANDLNDYENYRTDTEYDDALITKLYTFMFVNSYAALIFIAYVKASIGLQCQGPCMVELATSLTIIFASQLTVSKVAAYVEIVVNTELQRRENEAQRQKRLDAGKEVLPMTDAEKQDQFSDYDPSIDMIYDYSTIVMQYGYVTLFVAACPIAPMLAYISNYAEIRLDGYKMLYLTKRPLPVGAEDIGTWLDIMQLTSIASVITNAALVVYTMDLTNNFSDVGQLWIFIGFQYTIFVIMGIFAWWVDDMPNEVQIQLDRQSYVQERAKQEPEALIEQDNRLQSSSASRPTQTNLPDDIFEIHRTDVNADEQND
mmetsp:Transcript_21771/g.36403  ORF Transcript_21771/g.36403 Transcript_21771/m.36403 type:complete len:780 (+) Transcript_21771:27-2366(+)|eukprot:CAMPEP_0174955374 /NCGR_PEP_ID=MMETSP0004_2-20121128/946_1 /TAXON_ID=420556 /ORGANISM="Ochromonas sp., Strain CCMP1393" /LENGTH=779 /DNA_ID=CAMNT_0016203295 /DNA_START=12 /DNA_END=2351 /DNA_ORIENTATION=+